MLTTRSALSAAALVACLGALTACSGAAAPEHAGHGGAPTSTATGNVDAVDQTGDGRSVTVAAVNIDAGGLGGWIALHRDLDGRPGPVKYFVAVPAGGSRDVVIATPEGISSGAYWPMLHVDDSVIGTYEFPTNPMHDQPAKDGSGIVMKKITVTVG